MQCPHEQEHTTDPDELGGTSRHNWPHYFGFSLTHFSLALILSLRKDSSPVFLTKECKNFLFSLLMKTFIGDKEIILPSSTIRNNGQNLGHKNKNGFFFFLGDKNVLLKAEMDN